MSKHFSTLVLCTIAFVSLATATYAAPVIWNQGSFTFTKSGQNQEDCILASTCLTRVTVLYNSVEESPTGMQPCPGYIGPANTEWAIGDINDWSGLKYQPLYETIGCFPPNMVGVPMVAHLIEEDIYLQVTFSFWQQGGGNFQYTRTTEPGAIPAATKFDFDGDSKTDLSVFRPDQTEWWYLKSSDAGNGAFSFGTATDQLVPADYTGDGKTDIAFWRPSNGEWFVLKSEDSTFYSVRFGVSGDIPAPGDFDGDGKADTAVFRPESGTWFIENSSGTGTTIQRFGAPDDVPTVADFDGDGKDDIAIYRPDVSEWWQNRSEAGLIAYQFGSENDKAVVADYTGDGSADVAFWRPSTGEWFVLQSEDNGFFTVPYGIDTDLPTPGDYDGDGTADFAVFRPSTNTWYIQGSTSGYTQSVFGQPGDIPLPNVFVSP